MARNDSFISLRMDGLKDVLEMLDAKKAQKAAASALKRMTEMVKTEASSTIREEYAVKKSDLDPFMKVRLPQWNNLSSSTTVSGKPIPLTYFGAKQLTAQNRIITRSYGRQLKRTSRTLRSGVTFQIIKKITKNLPHAFMIYDRRLNRMVVVYRKTSKRDSIRSVNVVTIASLFGNRKTMAAVEKRINDNWHRLFKHELLRAMNNQAT